MSQMGITITMTSEGLEGLDRYCFNKLAIACGVGSVSPFCRATRSPVLSQFGCPTLFITQFLESTWLSSSPCLCLCSSRGRGGGNGLNLICRSHLKTHVGPSPLEAPWFRVGYLFWLCVPRAAWLTFIKYS